MISPRKGRRPKSRTGSRQRPRGPMPVALNDDQSALAQTVAAFAERHGARESTRKDAANHKAGERPDHWLELISLGLHAVHLPEEVGGQGGSVEDIAVVIGEAGRALLPARCYRRCAPARLYRPRSATMLPPGSSSVSPLERPPLCLGLTRL
jgi:alkylation response protein AidB-like acyl-CoA dehydrogenase